MKSKKFLSIYLCFLLVFVFSLGSSVYAQSDNIESENGIKVVQDDNKETQNNVMTTKQAGEYLSQIGLYIGYDDGTLRLDRNITRAEFATLSIRIEGLENLQEAHKGETIFKDMEADHWASGYVNIAVSQNLIKGFEDRTFRPEEQITYVQALAVVIRILGYEKDVMGEWPDNYVEVGKNLGLNRYIDLTADDVINRGEIALLICNALEVVISE